MPLVRTVTGPIEPAQLGRTLVHEHVFAALPGYEIDFLDPLDEADVIERAVKKLEAVKEFGVTAVVDATPMNWYRRPDLLQQISERSEVFIIASTGLYTERMGYPFHIKMKSVDELTELFTAEIEEGMLGTSIQAGVIKLATGQEAVGKYEARALHAAVRTQQTTGVGIITHTEGPTGGMEQVKAFTEAGADLRRVMIGHLDNSTDSEYHKEVARSGARLGFDRIGHYRLVPHEDRLKAILALIEAGFGDQLMLAHDCVAASKGSWFITEEAPHWEEYGYTFLFRELLPKLEESGVPSEVIETILSDNPRQLLAGEG